MENRLTKRTKYGVEFYCEVSNEEEYKDSVNEVINKLAEFEDLEEQGLLLYLPCKLATTVYKITSDRCYNYCRKEYACNSMPYSNDCMASAYVSETIFTIEMFNWIDKSIFLTEEKAQRALKKIKCIEGNINE